MRFTIFIFAILLLTASFAPDALALEPLKYTSIVDLPNPPGSGVTNVETLTAQDFIRILYALSISIAALLAVVKIIYAGIQYMLTDVVTSKAKAKKDVWGAILGLIIVVAAVFILETINPQLARLTFFENAPPAIKKSTVTPPSADASGSYDLEGLTPAEKTQVVKQLQCPTGSQLVVGTNEAHCEYAQDTNQGTVFNTSDKFAQYADKFPADKAGAYNEWVSPYEPTGVTEGDVMAVVTSAPPADDYVFVVKKIEKGVVTSNGRDVREQQEQLCNSEKNGNTALVDSGNFSVCVIKSN